MMATGVHRGTVYDHFEENDQLCRLIDTLPETSNEQIARETNQESVTGQLTVLSRQLTHPRVDRPNAGIVDKYQEQPHLLDPYMGECSHVAMAARYCPSLYRVHPREAV